MLKPDVSHRVKNKQRAQQASHDTQAKNKTFKVGDQVFAKEFPSGKHFNRKTETLIETLVLIEKRK